jgi:hypothetical protein
MKITIMTMAVTAMCISASVNAQQTWDPNKNPTVDSIRSKYEGKLVVSKPAPSIDQVFPVIGQYESPMSVDAKSVSVTIDEMNKGIIWITGLPQGKIKAMLKRSPATYRIPPQIAEDGKQIPEGTVIYDKETNMLSICIGKKFNETEPATVFLPQPVVEEVAPAIVKTKSKTKPVVKEAEPKPWMYTGNKIEKSTASNQ